MNPFVIDDLDGCFEDRSAEISVVIEGFPV